MANPKFLYDNRLNDATPTASSTAPDYSVLYLRDWRPYTKWKPVTLPATVDVDCGVNAAADYMAVWGHTLHSSGCTIELWGADEAALSDLTLVRTHTPSDDKPFVLTFNSVPYRHWHVVVRDANSGAVAPTIAILAIGAALTVPQGVESPFDPLARTIVGQDNRSAGGYPLGRVVYYETWDQAVMFTFLTWAWLRDSWLPAWTGYLRDKPFIFAWDVDSDANVLHLVGAKDQFATPHRSGSKADLTVNLVGLISK